MIRSIYRQACERSSMLLNALSTGFMEARDSLIFCSPNVSQGIHVVSRATDWLRQASRDLEHAEGSVELGDYE